MIFEFAKNGRFWRVVRMLSVTSHQSSFEPNLKLENVTMIDFYDPYGTRREAREYNTQKKIRNLEDVDDRADRLTPELVAHWTRVITHVQRIVPVRERPCSYKPWSGALREYSRNPPYIGELPPKTQSMSSALVTTARDIAQPGWPTPRNDLIEFALVFLEADVMLFGSGYVKRHLIKRLQQSSLSDLQIARLDDLMRRAVTDGAGLEEFRAYCKLAAHFVSKRQLPHLTQWLEDSALGAVLTLGSVDVETFVYILSQPKLSAEDQRKLRKVSWRGQRRWGVVYPDMLDVVDTRIEMVGPSPKSRRNAYLMLRSIQKRAKSEHF